MSYQAEIEDYEDAATGELLSIAELQFSLASRDTLYTSSLSLQDRERVHELDRMFIERAGEVRSFLATYGDADGIFNDKPLQRWWWHITRIATGHMSIDLPNRTVVYEGQTYKY
ncbi:hypothetical protein [Paenibacillus glucanolyticus]|uniref:hypothetical protein n=1 Tax=Paenibacillus glucanolyticus TaxID=59843 RepID=UPI00128DAE88|nr:hypothetical protein [Paenibacillus glucanolyticus]MPY20031.1 hypothetical protein [Paenibacillus glucanolyticus]